MKKMRRLALVLTIIGLLADGVGLLADKQCLRNNIIRLHVVANSDSERDQNIKLQVRDTVTNYLQTQLQTFTDKEQANAYLAAKLPELEELANHTLRQIGSYDKAKVTLKEEAFGTRVYDTFALPAGVYDSLRIEIGQAQGKNWWCVVFPSFCLPAVSETFQDTAAAAGFDDDLIAAIGEDDGYELRFYLLDCLGKWENFFFQDES